MPQPQERIVVEVLTAEGKWAFVESYPGNEEEAMQVAEAIRDKCKHRVYRVVVYSGDILVAVFT